jgi:hypothetical protein
MKTVLTIAALLVALATPASALEIENVISFPPDGGRKVACTNLDDAIALQRRLNESTASCRYISGYSFPAELKWKVIEKTRTRYSGPQEAYYCLEPVGYDPAKYRPDSDSCYWIFLADRWAR